MNKNKTEAIKLRKAGKTYNEIQKVLKVPKGTLSYWFKGKDFDKIKKEIYSKTQKKWSDNITKFNKSRARQIWQERGEVQKIYSHQIKTISKRELLLIGAALYWAEGYKKTKWQISFCNSDPIMIKIIMKFFREVCQAPEEKLKLRLQVHPHISQKQTEKFWSKLTKISTDRFCKTQTIISKSSKGKRNKNSLPYGIVHILISDKSLVDKIKGWIAGLKEIC